MRNLEEKCVSLLEEIRREHELSEQLLQAGFQRCKKVGELILLEGMPLQRSLSSGCSGIVS